MKTRESIKAAIPRMRGYVLGLCSFVTGEVVTSTEDGEKQNNERDIDQYSYINVAENRINKT